MILMVERRIKDMKSPTGLAGISKTMKKTN
jgi:hypothetical protein